MLFLLFTTFYVGVWAAFQAISFPADTLVY